MSNPNSPAPASPDLGDLVVILLASSLAGLKDRLAADGFARAATLVGELTDTADRYIGSIESHNAAD